MYDFVAKNMYLKKYWLKINLLSAAKTRKAEKEKRPKSC